MTQFSRILPDGIPGDINIEIEGLNQEEFDTLIGDPDYLELFTSNPENQKILTPEQMEIINNLIY